MIMLIPLHSIPYSGSLDPQNYDSASYDEKSSSAASLSVPACRDADRSYCRTLGSCRDRETGQGLGGTEFHLLDQSAAVAANV